MSTETRSTVAVSNPRLDAVGGALAGIVASAVMAIPLLSQMPGVVEMAMPAMYGITGPAAAVGMGVHLFHGAVFGILFAAAFAIGPLAEYAQNRLAVLAAGVGYGVLVWIVAAALVMPVWLSTVGFGGAPPLPNFNVTSLIGHVVFGAALGAVFPAVTD